MLLSWEWEVQGSTTSCHCASGHVYNKGACSTRCFNQESQQSFPPWLPGGYKFNHLIFDFLVQFGLHKIALTGCLEINESFVQHLFCSTHVDDISGGPIEDEAFNLYTASKKIFHEEGFNPRKFLTNFKHLQERINLQVSPKPNDWPLQDELTFLFRDHFRNLPIPKDGRTQGLGSTMEPRVIQTHLWCLWPRQSHSKPTRN